MEWTSTSTTIAGTHTSSTNEPAVLIHTILNDLIEFIEKNSVSMATTIKNLNGELARNDETRERELWTEIDDYFENCDACYSDDSELCMSLDDLTFGRWRSLPLSTGLVRCDACKAKESMYWRRVARRLIVCNSCFYKKTYLILFNDDNFKKSLLLDPNSVEETSTQTRTKETRNHTLVLTLVYTPSGVSILRKPILNWIR